MLAIDGSQGEGGGQVLRTSLALSLVTGRPFRITAIRAGRERPGLLRQHLTAVQAAAAVGGAGAEGAELGSRELAFSPGRIRGGAYRFAVGSAGSATLVFQTVLPALLRAPEPSRLVLEGGTHNPSAPPFEFLERAFLPLVERLGPRAAARLERYGFYPAGGGRFTAEVAPVPALSGFHLRERGEVRRLRAKAVVSRLPRHIARRELETLARLLPLRQEDLAVEEVETPGPGNAVLLEIESGALTEVFAGFGRRGVPAERVAQGVAEEARRYLGAEVPVGRHLADQLLLPLALAGGGSFRTLPLSPHAATGIEVIRQFLEVGIEVREEGDGGVLVRVGP